MATEIEPVAENWYVHLDKGQPFQVLSVDPDAELVEIQYFGGNLEEVNLSDWYAMDIAIGEEPESWAGAMDIGETDDYGTEVTDTQPSDWSESVAEIRIKDEQEPNSRIEAAEDVTGEGFPVEERREEEP